MAQRGQHTFLGHTGNSVAQVGCAYRNLEPDPTTFFFKEQVSPLFYLQGQVNLPQAGSALLGETLTESQL